LAPGNLEILAGESLALGFFLRDSYGNPGSSADIGVYAIKSGMAAIPWTVTEVGLSPLYPHPSPTRPTLLPIKCKNRRDAIIELPCGIKSIQENFDKRDKKNYR
jgi:hypothetical protein